MHSHTYIRRYTPAVLEALCKSKGVTPEELRLGTLRGILVDLSNLLENALPEIHPDDRAAFEDLRDRVRLAISDE